MVSSLSSHVRAQERPALNAMPVRLAQLLDRDDAVPQYASAARRLSETPGTLAKSATAAGPAGRLAVAD